MSKTGNATNERELTPVELDAVEGDTKQVIWRNSAGNAVPASEVSR